MTTTTKERVEYDPREDFDSPDREEEKFDENDSPKKLYGFLDQDNPVGNLNDNVVQKFQSSKNDFNERQSQVRKQVQDTATEKYSEYNVQQSQVKRQLQDATNEKYNVQQSQIKRQIQETANEKYNGINYESIVRDRISASTQNKNIDQQISQNANRAQSYGAPQTSTVHRASTMGRGQSFQLNQNEIVISVLNPERRGGSVGKLTYYDIQGSDKDGEFKANRSQDDFTKVRNVLVKRWPGCYVPSVPPKRLLTKANENFLEGRRKELEMFVQKITELPHLHYSREYQVFLRSTNPNLEQELEPFQKVVYDDVIMRYKTVFKQILQNKPSPKDEEDIAAFETFLTTVHSQFKSFKKVLKKTVAARKQYYDQLLALHHVMSTGYEKSVLSKIEASPDSNQVFNNNETGDLDGKVEGVKQAGDFGSIEYLHAWMKAENREIGAILQAIKQKGEYATKKDKSYERWSSTTRGLEKANAGGRSLKAIVTFKSSSEEAAALQALAIAQDKEQNQLKVLYDYIVLVLAYSEVGRFKKHKTDQYHKVVRLAAQYELDNLRNLTDYWSTILTLDLAASRNANENR